MVIQTIALLVKSDEHEHNIIYNFILTMYGLIASEPKQSSSSVNSHQKIVTRSSRYISLVTPKANFSFDCLSFRFSATNDWNELQKPLKLETHISLTSSMHQLSEQLTDYCTCTQPIYNLAQTTTSSSTVFIYLF